MDIVHDGCVCVDEWILGKPGHDVWSIERGGH